MKLLEFLFKQNKHISFNHLVIYFWFIQILIVLQKNNQNIAIFFDNTATLIEIKIDRYSQLINRYLANNDFKRV